MKITVEEHYDEWLGEGYYLSSEFMDRKWYRGKTPEEAIEHFRKQFHLEGVKIICIKPMWFRKSAEISVI